MTKHILATLLTLLCLSTTTFAQRTKLVGTWVTPAGEQMIIDDPELYKYNFLTNFAGTSKNLYLKILKDTLRFYDEKDSNAGHGKTHYDLVIVSITDSTLALRPSSKMSSRFFQNKRILQFSAQEYITDSSIHFEKLIYHIRGSWDPHNVDLQIKKNRSFYLSSQSDRYGPARREEGNYTGVLSDSLYKELIWCLKTCNLRRTRFEEGEIKDSDKVTLIVYFNGIRRYLRSDAPPQITSRLFHLLESVYDYADRKPARKRILEE